MPNQALKDLIENLNVNRVKGEVDVYFCQMPNGVEGITCSSDDKNYINSLVNGLKQHFGITPEIKSEVKLTTTAEFFKPIKPEQFFHYIQLSKADLLQLCHKFSVFYADIKKGEVADLQINPNLKNK